MKRALVLAAVGITFFAGGVTAIAADVGVSVSVGQSGCYGRIDIGSHAPPQVVYQQPVRVHAAPYQAAPPVYLRVPPGHAKRRSRHCDRYGACGAPVYFVQEQWYRQVYAPRYVRQHNVRGQHEHQRRGGYGEGRDWERGRHERHGGGRGGRGRDRD